MGVHVPTLLATIVMVSATLAIVVGIVAWGRRQDGLGLWSLGLALHGAAYVLFSLRQQVSDLTSIVVANILLAAAFALFAEGLYQFQQRPAPRGRPLHHDAQAEQPADGAVPEDGQ